MWRRQPAHSDMIRPDTAMPPVVTRNANIDSRAATAILAGATLALPVVALADQHGRAQLDHSGTDHSPPLKASDQGPLKHEKTSVASGTVTAIDPKARLVTLQTEGGQTFEVLAGDEVKNFDEIAVGDVVKATYTESFAFQVVPKAQTPGASQSMDRIPGGAKVGQKVTSSFTVASVDPTTNILGVTLPDGNTKQIHFEHPKAQTRLKSLNRGDVISVTYTYSAAIQLEKLAN